MIKAPKNWGLFLAAIWFIAWGVLPFLKLGETGLILQLLAIVAGILLLLGR